jgi:hypothetical protein
MRDQSLNFDSLIHVKQDLGLFVCLLACFTPRTSLPEMRSDELVNKISGEVINGEKPRRFQLMVLVLFTNNDFHGTFHGDMILSKSSFPFDQSKRILRLNVQNIFKIWLLLYAGFPVIEVSNSRVTFDLEAIF